MDKNGKLFGKISIVDLVVILLVLTVAVGTVYRFTAGATQVAEGDVTINYTIRIENVRAFTLYYYHAGLGVYDRQTGQFIGTIMDFTVTPHYAPQILENGEMVHAPFPDTHVNIYLEIETDGRETDGAVYAQGTFEVAANSVTNIRTRYVQVEGIIHSVETRPMRMLLND